MAVNTLAQLPFNTVHMHDEVGGEDNSTVIIIIIYLYSLKTWHEYYKQCYTKNLHTIMSF